MTALILILALLGVFILGVLSGVMLTRYLIQRELKRTMSSLSTPDGGIDIAKLMEQLAPPRITDN